MVQMSVGRRCTVKLVQSLEIQEARLQTQMETSSFSVSLDYGTV